MHWIIMLIINTFWETPNAERYNQLSFLARQRITRERKAKSDDMIIKYTIETNVNFKLCKRIIFFFYNTTSLLILRNIICIPLYTYSNCFIDVFQTNDTNDYSHKNLIIYVWIWCDVQKSWNNYFGHLIFGTRSITSKKNPILVYLSANLETFYKLCNIYVYLPRFTYILNLWSHSTST